ncbi:hypothetical protein FEM03_22265 [Phragmitibacter flavus]|uniref:Uncharacterized protein n=1 Tax=Phragmitibacter flavus TaxID=2576071 RepID=A0A5R8K861_9BACT|nr:hypothetical protein [Phragmitibacter flavus]TLD68532.1 hypothetical protein FEM03_22265 [Phragmitibacter flavus]
MNVLNINTRKQFEDWLTDNVAFADARILSLTAASKPDPSSTPSAVTIELAYQIEGSYKAHSRRVSRVFRIRATKIAQYSLSADAAISSEHWSEGIAAVESESPIAFELDVPARLSLHCSEISVEERPKLFETVAPRLSNREVFANAPRTLMPTPAQWQTRFNALDQDVVWHIYRSEPQQTAEVPIANYEGWFLQVRRDLDDAHQGIFFFSCRPEKHGFRVAIQNQGASKLLWQSAMRVLSEFDGVEIHCGNCEFPGADFFRAWTSSEEAQQAAS